MKLPPDPKEADLAIQSTALSLMVLAIIALVGGALYLLRRGQARRQAVLMLILALVLGANVAIVAVPGEGGQSVIAPAAP